MPVHTLPIFPMAGRLRICQKTVSLAPFQRAIVPNVEQFPLPEDTLFLRGGSIESDTRKEKFRGGAVCVEITPEKFRAIDASRFPTLSYQLDATRIIVRPRGA